MRGGLCAQKGFLAAGGLCVLLACSGFAIASHPPVSGAATDDLDGGAPVQASSARGGMNALAEFETVLASRYALADLKVDWTLGAALARELAGLEQSHAEPTQPLPAECPDRVVVRLQGLRDGRPVDLMIPGNLLVSGYANRALRTLPAGSVIQPGDTESVQSWAPPSATCGEVTVGLFLSKAVVAGQWIPCASLREPPSVRRNQELVVLYRAPGLELRGRGIARKDGWPGEEIAVRVAGAERDCRAEVVGPGTVQVALHGEAVTR